MVGGWVLDFTRLMQSHLPTKVEVEVEDELGKNLFENGTFQWLATFHGFEWQKNLG